MLLCRKDSLDHDPSVESIIMTVNSYICKGVTRPLFILSSKLRLNSNLHIISNVDRVV